MVSVVHDDALVLIPGKNRCGDLPRLKNAEKLIFPWGLRRKYKIVLCLQNRGTRKMRLFCVLSTVGVSTFSQLQMLC